MKNLLRLAILLLAVPAIAQTAPAKPPTTPAAPAAKADAPQLTELEQTRLENLDLRSSMLVQQAWDSQGGRQLSNAYQALLMQLNQEHPGYTFNPQVRAFVKGAAPTASPAKPAEAAKKPGR